MENYSELITVQDSAGVLKHCHLDNVAVKAQLLHEGNLLHHEGAESQSQGWTDNTSSRHAGAPRLGLMQMHMLVVKDCWEAARQSSSTHMARQQQQLTLAKAYPAVSQGSIWCTSIKQMTDRKVVAAVPTLWNNVISEGSAWCRRFTATGWTPCLNPLNTDPKLPLPSSMADPFASTSISTSSGFTSQPATLEEPAVPVLPLPELPASQNLAGSKLPPRQGHTQHGHVLELALLLSILPAEQHPAGELQEGDADMTAIWPCSLSSQEALLLSPRRQ